MSENILSLGELCAKLLSKGDEPALSGTLSAVECRKVLFPQKSRSAEQNACVVEGGWRSTS